VAHAWNPRKVVIVGAGAVGATFAYALAQSGLPDEIVLIDANHELAMGQVLDLAHGQAFFPTVHIRHGDYLDYADAHIVAIAAGAKMQPGESRLSLLQRNAALIRTIVDEIVKQDSHAVILVVTNPVDILTFVAQKFSGWPPGQVIGSGTVLDSARFSYLLSRHCAVDVHDVHAYILGEHGDSEFAAWSMTNMAGLPIEEYCRVCGKCADPGPTHKEIVEQVRESAYHIIGYKGATNFAVGLALVRISAAILRNQHSVMTVSAVLQGQYGLNDVALGIPCVISQKGVERILDIQLSCDEQQLLSKSAAILHDAIKSLNLPR
jgi:L-lactate dehydrogenase